MFDLRAQSHCIPRYDSLPVRQEINRFVAGHEARECRPRLLLDLLADSRVNGRDVLLAYHFVQCERRRRRIQRACRVKAALDPPLVLEPGEPMEQPPRHRSGTGHRFEHPQPRAELQSVGDPLRSVRQGVRHGMQEN
jgi:hypothetical protein